MSTLLERINAKVTAATGRKKQRLELKAARIDATQKRRAARVAVRAARTAKGATKDAKRAAAAPIVLAARQACKVSLDKLAAMSEPLPPPA